MINDSRGKVVGRYDETLSDRSFNDEVGGRENDSVVGRESPGKEDKRMLTFDDAILVMLNRYLQPY